MHKVMIVDDERPARELLKMLADWGMAGFEIVAEATNGKDALQKYREFHPDLIITDIQMPVMDGIELMRAVRENDPEQRFVILSCHESFEYAREALKMGAMDYLIKDALTKEALSALLMQLQLAMSPEGSSVTTQHSPRIQRILAYIEENYHKDITLQDIADTFCLHKAHLARVFKEEMGMSLGAHVINVRIARAKQLLRSTELRVGEVQYMVGFNNPQNFYALFKKNTGVSPAEYRSSSDDLSG